MKGLLKFITCGSVDDGKSTLIGHILYDSKLLYADQERALELDSKAGSRGGKIDYSLLLDGLTEEREQGITIDVAYRYFTTDARSFIVADTPGHEEYTRNMAVGASFADLAVILVDASLGVLVQTRRHARICALMGIRSFVFALNKMDLVGYREETYLAIRDQIEELAREIGLEQVEVIPVSATEGDNVTRRSDRMPWYEGPVLLSYLENIDVDPSDHEQGFYMPVQRVCRPDHTFRGFQGQVETGVVSVGDTLEVLPSHEQASVRSIYVAGHLAEHAGKGRPVTIQLDREIDVSRGCVLSSASGARVAQHFTATLLWMDEDELTNGRNFFVKLGTRLIPGYVEKIESVIDVNTGSLHEARRLRKNELASCRISLSEGIVADTYAEHPTLGELILIDRVTNHTSACGVITALQEERKEDQNQIDFLRQALKGQHPAVAVFVEGRDDLSYEQVKEVDRYLTSHYGRHTYLYVPGEDEDFETVTGHLIAAGLIVLLYLKEEQVEKKGAVKEEWLRDWTHETDPRELARIIKRKTHFSGRDAVHGDYI